MSNTALSLIIASRNRQESIRRLLTRLKSVAWPTRWELIVVDNGSSDGTMEVLRRHLAHLPLSIFHESKPGKSLALNLGLVHAQGNLVLFTDDDVSLPDYWLVEWEQVPSKYPDYNIFGGRINVDRSQIPGWIMESHNLQEMLLSEHDLGDKPVPYPSNRYPIGPNMAVRRSVLAGLNDPWPIAFGPGTRVPLGDEYGFLSKISPPSAKDRLYVPAPALTHTPDSLGFPSALRRCFLGGLAAGRLTDPISPDSPREAFHRLVGARLMQSHSLRELVCMGVRAGGVALGRLA